MATSVEVPFGLCKGLVAGRLPYSQVEGTITVPPSGHRTSNMAHRGIKKALNLDLPQPKRANIEDEAQGELQVIRVGLPRSGTTSLKAALETLGFHPCHHMSAGSSQMTANAKKTSSDSLPNRSSSTILKKDYFSQTF